MSKKKKKEEKKNLFRIRFKNVYYKNFCFLNIFNENIKK